MSSAIGQLSASFARLSSLERRFIVIVAVIVFVVINLVFVLPHFSDLGKIKNRFMDANAKLEKYNKEIAQSGFYQSNIIVLEGEGAVVPQEDQGVSFLQAIQNQVAQSGVNIVANNRQPDRTNQFFTEKAQALTTQSGEAQLVDFLYNLGAGNSLIRVRALSIRPDAPRTGLSANITLIASFQKKPPTRSAPSPGAKPPPATTTAPVVKTPVPAAKTPAPAVSVPPVKTNKPAGVPATKPSTQTKK